MIWKTSSCSIILPRKGKTPGWLLDGLQCVTSENDHSSSEGCHHLISGVSPEPPLSYWQSVWLMLKVCWPLILGNTLEWYEFSAYGYLIPELQENFFKGSSVLAWIGFAITFIMRPLGGILLGWVSDRFGRKVGVIISLTGMIGATVLQGCLPSKVSTPGSVLPNIGLGLMVVCRMSQGLFAGGEISGVSVSLGEHETKNCIGMAASMISFGGNLAFFLSSGIVGILHAYLTPEQMMLWGWRIPFVITIVPGIFALLMRLDMPETEAFIEMSHKEENKASSLRHFCATLHTVFCKNTCASLISIFGCAGIATLWYVGPIYSCDFVVKYRGVSASTALSIGSAAQLFALVCSPITGWLTDRIGVGKVILLGNTFIALCGIPVYAAMIEGPNATALVVVNVVFVFGLAQALAGSTIYLWALELFETSVRTTGMGVSYNLAVSYFGGCAPLVADILSDHGFLYAPGIMITVAGTISTFTLLLSRWLRNRGKLCLTHIRHSPY